MRVGKVNFFNFIKGRIFLTFFTFSSLATSRMRAIKDRIINVPMREEDISNTISSLPRPEKASGVVAIMWKRQKAMKNFHVEEFIRPDKLIDAVKKLKELGNPFYQDIEVNENFLQENEKNKESEKNT